MKRIILIIIILAIAAAIATIGWIKFSGRETSGKLLEICPDSWIINKMPGPKLKEKLNEQYFILNGERKELSDFNMVWVQQNCSLKPAPVY